MPFRQLLAGLFLLIAVLIMGLILIAVFDTEDNPPGKPGPTRPMPPLSLVEKGAYL
jgi:hypothetical protein